MVRQHLIHQVVCTVGANLAGRVKAAVHKLSVDRAEQSHALRPAPVLLFVEISCSQSGFKSSVRSGKCLLTG